MTDYNDLPLEHPAGHSLPMSLLADGVAARHGRRADDEESKHRSGDGPAYRGHGAQGSSGAGAARAGGSIRLIDVDSKVTQSPAGRKGGGMKRMLRETGECSTCTRTFGTVKRPDKTDPELGVCRKCGVAWLDRGHCWYCYITKQRRTP